MPRRSTNKPRNWRQTLYMYDVPTEFFQQTNNNNNNIFRFTHRITFCFFFFFVVVVIFFSAFIWYSKKNWFETQELDRIAKNSVQNHRIIEFLVPKMKNSESDSTMLLGWILVPASSYQCCCLFGAKKTQTNQIKSNSSRINYIYRQTLSI